MYILTTKKSTKKGVLLHNTHLTIAKRMISLSQKTLGIVPLQKKLFVHLDYQDLYIGDSHNEDAPSKMLVTSRSIYE
jgi:hypothetical protein